MQTKSNIIQVGRDVSAISQGLRVLRFLVQSNEAAGVTAIARGSDVSPSTSLNILRTLVNEGLVGFDRSTKTYRIDIGVLELARPLLNKSHIDSLRPHVQEIANKFGALTTIWKPVPLDKIILMQRVIPDVDVRVEMRVATRLPFAAGALGRYLMAVTNLSEAEILQKFSAVRWSNPLSFDAYLRDVHAAQLDGYAIDNDHLIGGVTSVASCLVNASGAPVMAVSASTLTGQLSDEDLKLLGSELSALCLWAGPAFYGVAASSKGSQ